MKKTLVKLHFKTPLHIGKRSLTDSEFTIKADTLFSALLIESGYNKNLLEAVEAGELRFSDCLPFIDNSYYIPKPMIHVESEEDPKLYKNLHYIPEKLLEDYIEGDLDAVAELEFFNLGHADLRMQVEVEEDPYAVGTYSFHENAGLYFIMEYKDDFIFSILDSLKYSGIGGKRSSGLGRFIYSTDEAFDLREDKLGKILLTTSMAMDNELDEVMEEAVFLLDKRSGFIHGSGYKKVDFYSFKPGSVFTKGFKGQIFNVGNDEHPVYRYGIPIFMGVDLNEL